MGHYLRPVTLEAAIALLAERPRTILAGGTDHFPARVLASPDEDILDIGALPDLRGITRRGDHWWLPCRTTWSELIETPLPPAFDALKAAARQVGGMQVQNAATLVGNVCNASPAADGIPCLLALDASIELVSPRGRRVLSLDAFVHGPRQTARRPDEIALGLRIPIIENAASSFEKLGARRYLVISIAMVAAVATFDAAGRIVRASVAVGACAPRARRLPALEAALIGARPDPALVCENHLAPLAPIDDARATATYRRAAALELLRRAIGGLTPVLARAA
jgi:CO/xanthine dehydrogenase FAD-binding subunit